VCEIGPRDFFRSLYVDSTTQGDFGHAVQSSVCQNKRFASQNTKDPVLAGTLMKQGEGTTMDSNRSLFANRNSP